MKHLFDFKIFEKDGILFSKVSGDKNKIHLDNNHSRNSIYGTKICHGVLIIIKFLQRLNFNQKNNFEFKYINSEFLHPTEYNRNIKVYLKKKTKNEEIYIIKQDEVKKVIIKFGIDNTNSYFEKKLKNFSNFKYLTNNHYNFDLPFFNKIKNLICFLSKYVGNIYPGKYSAINNILINKIDYQKSKNIKIMSQRMDKRFPLVQNEIFYENININFETSFLPKLSVKLKRPSKKIISKIKKISNNTMIIGASSGIGNDLYNLISYNTKIKLISTFYKSKFVKIKRTKNQIIKKIDIKKDIKKILYLIKKNNIKNLYYFATPKININKNSSLINKEYYDFYVKYPLTILKKCGEKLNFFYPSTSYINKKHNFYSNNKNHAEKLLRKIKKNKHNIKIVRFDEINTRQNLMLSNKKLLNMRDYLFRNDKLFNETFFLL